MPAISRIVGAMSIFITGTLMLQIRNGLTFLLQKRAFFIEKLYLIIARDHIVFKKLHLTKL